jgi:hypothetical protein
VFSFCSVYSQANEFPFALACLGSPPPRGSFFILDDKETNNQGLDLMSDKFVKAFWSSAQAPMKNRGGRAASGQW